MAMPTILVIGWGSTYGPIGAAVRRCRDNGIKVAQAHFRHVNPLPANTEDVSDAATARCCCRR